MKFIEKIKLFNSFAIKEKLISLSKILGISLYPDIIHKTGFKRIYSNFVFNLIAREKLNQLVKKNKNKIFTKKKYLKKTNHFVALPRSGSNLIRNLITTYVELYFKFGNGVPKYDGINDRWFRTNTTLISGDLQNAMSFNDQQFLDIKSFIGEKEFEQKKIVFSRHPVQKCNLFNMHEGRPIITLRNPKDQINSHYSVRKHKYKRSRIEEYNEDIKIKLLNKIVLQNKIYYKFWNNFVKNKIKERDFLIINYNETQNKLKNLFVKVLKFYEYKIDYEILDNALKINSKESYLNHFGARSKNSIRFVEFIDKDKDKEEIEEFLNKHSIKEINKDYDELKKA